MAFDQLRLSAEQLRRRCDPAELTFSSTAELSPLDTVIGQDRALRAISFGIQIKSDGYHMYALGPEGTGKTTTIRKFLEHDATDKPVPEDWLYVNNFRNPDQPRALRLPAGRGRQFRDDMDQLVDELKAEVPQAFEGPDYQQEQERLEQEFGKRSKSLFQQLERKAERRGFALLQTPHGMLMAPVINGDLLTPEELSRLQESQRAQIEQSQEALEQETRETMRQVQHLQREGRERARELDRQVVGFVVGHHIDDLKERYGEFPEVVAFLQEARDFLMKNVPAFKRISHVRQASPEQQAALTALPGAEQPSFDEYRVNLVVDNSETHGAPIVLERNPTVPNLVGRIDHQGQFGALVTNFRLLKCGALHKANGGYLMVDAIDVLTRPMAWDFLKRALKNREVVIEGVGEGLGAFSTRTLQPEPIPLELKVILVGDPRVYYLLLQMDSDFQELFKVKVDFNTDMAWQGNAAYDYGRFIATVCREEGLRHFSPSGVASIMEHSARLVGHRNKVATKFGDVSDMVRQSSYWAGINGHGLVQAEDVERAMDEQNYRANRIEERIREMVEEGTILIDTEGQMVGQINGLSVMPLGDFAFGRPSRITARTHVGMGGLTNIDREANLGGPIHNKGALILAGYLGGKYARDVPLALSASIVFEQLYEGVEGDSASSAELYALLSSLSRLPLRQDLAVTGSVNQKGEIQAIGGVNEKIEGFFDVCRVKGLSGTQGVIIPRANLKHLMLARRVVEAVEAGQFHIYRVDAVDEGIALLTGREAGRVRPDGTYPEGTVNALVQQTILGLAEKVKEFGARTEERHLPA